MTNDILPVSAGRGNPNRADATDVAKRSKDIMVGLKCRSRLFTEGIIFMACPVLLAISRGSAQSKIEKNKIAGEATHALAVATLMAGIFQFIIICLLNTLESWACAASKFLIHLCILCFLGLASFVMALLVGARSFWGYVLAMVIIGLATIVMACKSCRKDKQEGMGETEFKVLKGSLDASANFSVAVTSLLFVGLEALALEGIIKGDAHRIDLPIGVSLGTCGLGLLIMLAVSVHPLVYYNNMPSMTNILQGLSVVLGIAVCAAVSSFTEAAVGNIEAVPYLLALTLVPFGVSGLYSCLPAESSDVIASSSSTAEGDLVESTDSVTASSSSTAAGDSTEKKHEPAEPAEPASLELTKIMFATFLVVSVSVTGTANDNSIGMYTTAFIWFTAAAIIMGVEWRLMTHVKKPSDAWQMGANSACLISHLAMACAVIPLAMLAAEAMKMPAEVAAAPSACY